MLKETVFPQISASPSFQELVKPIPSPGQIRDAEFYIRRDGIIFNADGYAHPENEIVGNALYVPDKNGEKRIFGIHYRKISVFPGTHEPIPYAQMGKFLREIDPSLDQSRVNPWPFQYEQLLSFDEFAGYIPGERAFRSAVEGRLGNPEKMLADLESLTQLLELDLSEYVMGLTGTPALGQVQAYHDLDIVFRGSLEQNRNLADKMRELVIDEPERRLHEGGKSWLIRFFNRDGVSNGTLMCCFFGYRNLEDAYLRNFTITPLREDLEIEGSVADAMHAFYTPTVVCLHDVKVIKINGQNVKERLPDDLPLIIYHTATRGELNSGDDVWAHGALVEVATPELAYPALVVVEREGVRNQTPPWEGYYTRDRY